MIFTMSALLRNGLDTLSTARLPGASLDAHRVPQAPASGVVVTGSGPVAVGLSANLAQFGLLVLIDTETLGQPTARSGSRRPGKESR